MIPKILTVPSPTASSAPCTFSSHSHRISRCDPGQQQKVKANKDFLRHGAHRGGEGGGRAGEGEDSDGLGDHFLVESWIPLRFKKQAVFFIQHASSQEKSSLFCFRTYRET